MATIALGVGANSAIFSVIDAVMLRPLPFRDADRVILINERTPQFPVLSLSAENYRDVCREAGSLQACGAFRGTTLNMSGGSEPERVVAKMLSANVLPMLGVEPIVGRGFSEQEDKAGGEPVVMLSHYLWQARFDGTLDDRDRQGAPRVIVINETMARTHFGREPALGQRIQLGTEPDPDPQFPYMEVVGVVGDVRQQPDAEAKSEMYVPYAQYPDSFLRRMYSNVTLVVRAEANPALLASPVREIVRGLDGDQPIANVRTLDEVLETSVSQPRFRTFLLGFFALIALTLAAIGVYGLLAHGVAQRVNEFGVRIALGASPRTVLALVLRQGLALSLAGVGIGLAASVAAVRALNTVLFDISPWDPIAWVVSAGTLLAVSLLASWVPARRALRVDPVVALRA